MVREADYVNQHIDTDDRLLDVGCGIGSLEERLRDYETTGIDRSETMVRTARQRVSGSFLIGEAQALPIQTDEVDAVVFVAALSFIPDTESALAEAVRVLKPDGTFVALVLNTQSDYVQSNLKREGSYFQRIVHRDSDAIADQVLDVIDGTREYYFGIDGTTVFESDDPTTAAVTAVVGTPESQ